jgi:hypothetical protein
VRKSKATLAKFLPDEQNRKLFPAFIGFCIAAIGVIFGFIAANYSLPILGLVAFALTAFGVLLGIAVILWRNFSLIFLGGWRKDHDEYLEKLKPKQPWEN